MLCNIEADNLPAVVSQDEHHEQRNRNVADGTMNMSIAAMPSVSVRRKLCQVGDGDCGRRTMYLATVA